MKKLFTTIMASLAAVCMMAQGWPENYGGVMLQGFYWDYYDDSDWGTWNALKGQANDLEGYIDLIWVPNSARTKNDWCVEHNYLADMGYMPCWWLNHDNTIFGNTADLKSMIAAYQEKGIGIIEDVVINHKNGQNDWCDFPDETVTVGNKTYTLNWTLADICNNDNGGYVRTMFDVTGAADTGDDFDGCRDLDHTRANVQKNVKTYLDYLQQELGYAGFRYDMVKGYGPQFVGIYNAYAKPTFSVGEFWDNWDGTTWWVNGTKQNGTVQSAAFDFPLKFLINDAFNGSFDGSKLSSQGMAGHDDFKRYSVTFVDNHDTYRDATKMSNDHHVLAANAFILAMPGTPCIFLPHWKTHKDDLKRMIAARKAAGITNQSAVTKVEGLTGGIGFEVTGTNGNVLVTLGYVTEGIPSGYKQVVAGDSNNHNFCFYVSNGISDNTLNARPSSSNANLGTARVDMPSGTYYQGVTVNVSPSDPFTTLVYTEDGSDPQTNTTTTITSTGHVFNYNSEGVHKLKVGVKGASGVRDIQTYSYVITNEEITDITIYVRADKEPLYLYAWDDNGTLTSAWPGTQLSAMKSANGVNFFYMTFPKPSTDYTLNYILNQGTDDTKTPDQTGIGSDIFTALGNGNVVDLSSYTGATIEDPIGYDDITVYVEANRYPIKLYVWNGNGTKLLGDWPGKQMSHTACVNGKTWLYETIKNQKNQSPINLIISDGSKQSANFENVTGDVFVSYDGGDKTTLTNKTADYAGYPPTWYEQGEICAFFVSDNNNGWDDSKNISAYVWKENPKVEYAGAWPGTKCTFLGFNEDGGRIWKWKYNDGASLPENTRIIFTNKSNSDNGGNNQTADCTFKNGAWYNTSNTGNNTSPVSTAVTPSNEISIAALGTPTTATNWNGKSEKVAEKGNNETMTKDFSLTAGENTTSYVVQAIVRGTAGSSVLLSAKNQSASVSLTGLDGATSSVQTNGIVEAYVTGANNGWQKVELSFTLAANTSEKVTVQLSSDATQWQLGALKVLPGTTGKTKATSAVTETYVDVRGESGFSFYDRGANRNALIKANVNTLPAQLPYNVIVDGARAQLRLTDGNFSFNNAGQEFTAASVSYDRTFTPGQRSTICLPFSLTAEEADAAGTFWALDSYTAGNLHFVKVNAPQANTPYIFEAASKEGATTVQPFLLIAGKTVPTSSLVTVEKGGVSFVGVNERRHLVSEDGGITYYGYRQSDASFVRVGTGEGAYINPFRAYLQSSAPLTARMSVSFDDDVMGIQEVTPTVEPMMQQTIYNLGGQRVRTPNKKGLYIKGGKKYLVK